MKRGSITLYLCLTLSLLLSLLFAAIRSAGISAGRVVLSSALEQGVFSLFSEYDSELFKRYGLLFLDAGRGESTLQLQRLTDETEEYAKQILYPSSGAASAGGELLKFGEPSVSVLAYTLAPDGSGAAFSDQVCRAMKDALPSVAAGQASNAVKEQLDTVTRQENSEESYPVREADQLYKNMKNAQADEKAGAGIKTDFTEADMAAAEQIDLGSDYGDPVEEVSAAKKLGILNLAIPSGKTVSGAAVQKTGLPSGRSLQRGVGICPAAADGVVDRTLMNEYAVRFFPCFTNHEEEEGLLYQAEYLIAGKLSDAENLKSVLNRLMIIREASNFAYLSTNKARRAETLAAAMAVCSACMLPVLAPAVAVAIRAAWAYAEGIIDLRTLLDGGKIPLVKTDGSWKLSIRQLPDFRSRLDAGGSDTPDGLDYLQYLRILLLVKPTKDLVRSMMDMVEHTMRTAAGRPEFRIDCCVDAVNMELKADLYGHELTGTEYYRYGAEA